MRVVAVALVASLFLSGCASSGGFDPLQKFPTADQRWSDRLDAAADVYYDVSLQPGDAAWSLSADAPEGFDVKVFRRGNLIDGDLGDSEEPFRVREMHWRPFVPQASGAGRVGVDCGGPCSYTFARNENVSALPEVRSLGVRYRDAADRATGDLTDGDFGSHDLEVPNGTRGVGMRFSVYAPDDWFRMTLTDADGDRRYYLQFPAVSIDDMAVTLPDDDGFPAGAWNLLVDCDGDCAYAHGFYYDRTRGP